MTPCDNMTPRIHIEMNDHNADENNVSKISSVYRFFRFNGIDILAGNPTPGLEAAVWYLNFVHHVYPNEPANVIGLPDDPDNPGEPMPIAANPAEAIVHLQAGHQDGGGKVSYAHVSRYLRKLFKENPAKAKRETRRLMKMLKA